MSHHIGQMCSTHQVAINGPRPPCTTCPPDRDWMTVSCRPGCPKFTPWTTR